MSLRTKFNLAILAVFIFGLVVTALLLQRVAQADARDEVVQNARIMIAAADAIRKYTVAEILPLTGNAKDGRFVAQSVPSFAAQTNFATVQKQYPDYSYKEATLNPTNPIDRATDWETDIINSFRNRPTLAEYVGERTTPNGPSLTLARPITIRAEACLECHSQPAQAPTAMLAVYGNGNGFGWHLNETIGAQIVSVPMSLPLQKAWTTFVTFMAILTGVFLVITVVLNLLLYRFVTKPVMKMAGIAEQVSLGNEQVEEFEMKGRDEIASLSQSFNRMRRSLESAMKMLEG